MWQSSIPQIEECNLDPKWLRSSGNLTQKLRDTFGVITLNLVEQKLIPATNYQHISAFNEPEYFIRRIFLSNQNTPLTLGICIFNTQGYQHYQDKIKELGTNAIGETLLYKDPNVSRSLFSYAVVTPIDFLHQQACQDTSADITENIWARSSIFSLAKGKMQLIELFLPTISKKSEEE